MRRCTTSTRTSRADSIKIRVKTYAHALRLHEERLQDLRTKKAASSSTPSIRKRLELLEMRKAQLALGDHADPTIDA